MKDNLPAVLPSLAAAFETEREDLRQLINAEGLSSEKAVRAARQALDRTGTRFAQSLTDVQLQRAGLWLLEMVKSGAGVLDTAAKADVVWTEVPRTSGRVIAGSTLFYGMALAFAVAGFLQGSRLTMLAALVLAALRFFDPRDWKHFLSKIPFFWRKKRKLLLTPDGQSLQARAQIKVEASGYVDALTEALKTADHVLARLAEPGDIYDWSDDVRLSAMVQNLLEARAVGDKDFAMQILDGELVGFLAASGIDIVTYSKKHAGWFDVLPALDLKKGTVKQAAPALVKDGVVIKRGTIWKA